MLLAALLSCLLLLIRVDLAATHTDKHMSYLQEASCRSIKARAQLIQGAAQMCNVVVSSDGHLPECKMDVLHASAGRYAAPAAGTEQHSILPLPLYCEDNTAKLQSDPVYAAYGSSSSKSTAEVNRLTLCTALLPVESIKQDAEQLQTLLAQLPRSYLEHRVVQLAELLAASEQMQILQDLRRMWQQQGVPRAEAAAGAASDSSRGLLQQGMATAEAAAGAASDSGAAAAVGAPVVQPPKRQCIERQVQRRVLLERAAKRDSNRQQHMQQP